MLFRSVQHWEDLDAQKGLLFFAQRLDEMTFEYSLDSYKAPTTNAPFLAIEAAQQIRIQKKAGNRGNSAPHILEELEVRLRDNIIVKDLLSLEIGRYLAFDKDNLDDSLSKLQVLKREISPHVYILKSMELLKKAIPKHEKKHIDYLCRELVCSLVNIGMKGYAQPSGDHKI